MKDIKIGKIVSTHALKGELKVISSFDEKEKAFAPGVKVYLSGSKQAFTSEGHRPHQKYDLLKLKEINSIEDAIKLKGKDIFVKRDDLMLGSNDYLLHDLVNMTLSLSGEDKGVIKEIIEESKNILLLVEYNNKQFYYPYNKDLIKKVDIKTKKVEMIEIEGLII